METSLGKNVLNLNYIMLGWRELKGQIEGGRWRWLDYLVRMLPVEVFQEVGGAPLPRGKTQDTGESGLGAPRNPSEMLAQRDEEREVCCPRLPERDKWKKTNAWFNGTGAKS